MALALDHLRILDHTDEQSAGCGRLLAELGEHEPFYYTYKRVLMWGRLREA